LGLRRRFLSASLAVALLASPTGQSFAQADNDPINPPPTPADWANLAMLPDWTGVWTPDIADQNAQIRTNPIPWNERAMKLVKTMEDEEKAGNPRGLFIDCLPESMPGWMMIMHNSFEMLFTPGRVTMLGESDSNRLRRIYTDGRPHPEDPDLTFHGHSIGKWEGDTLVISTVGVRPQTYISPSEAVGVPNGGDMTIIERIRLAEPDTLHVNLTITAPHVLTKPYVTTRIYYRQRKQKYDIIEGVCAEGFFEEIIDEDGFHFWKELPHDNGNPVPIAAPTQ